MKKIIAYSMLILVLSLSGCSTSSVKNEPNVVKKEEKVLKNYSPVTMNYDINGKKYTITFTKPPQKAVTMSQFMTEMLLALDLSDRMVGTAFMDNKIYPSFKQSYEKVPVLSEKYPSKEVLISTGADFVSGWMSAFDPKRVASVEDMLQNEMNPYLAKSIGKNGSLEMVYEDFEDLGKIFDVEDKAKQVVDKMKKDIEKIEEKIKNVSKDEEVKVLAYDSGEKEPFVVAAGGVSGDLIKKAKGENIFSDIKKGYATVSWEEIIQRNPDVIVIVDYGDTDYDTKLNFLKNNEALKDVKAIKDNRFIRIGLSDLSPGVRNVKAIETLGKGLYPQYFK